MHHFFGPDNNKKMTMHVIIKVVLFIGWIFFLKKKKEKKKGGGVIVLYEAFHWSKEMLNKKTTPPNCPSKVIYGDEYVASFFLKYLLAGMAPASSPPSYWRYAHGGATQSFSVVGQNGSMMLLFSSLYPCPISYQTNF